MSKLIAGRSPLRRLATVVVMVMLGAAALAESPAVVVEQAASELGKRLDGRKEELRANPAELYVLIDDILLPRFDRDYAARLVLGRHWRSASAEQRTRFVEAFYRSLLKRYADGVLEFDQSKVEILPHRGDDEDKRTMVRTIVTLDDGTRVPVNYALVRRDDGWMMFDVNIEGISYVRNFRAEMNSEIQAKGLAAVIKRLEAEAAGES